MSVANPGLQLKPGMVAALELTEKEAPAPAAVIPLSAVVRAPGKPGRFAVFVVDESKQPPVARVREVEFGDLLGNRIPVTSGLGEGEKVVVLGAGLLADGEAVEVIP